MSHKRLKCAKCKRIDKDEAGYVGTSTIMRCLACHVCIFYVMKERTN